MAWEGPSAKMGGLLHDFFENLKEKAIRKT